MVGADPLSDIAVLQVKDDAQAVLVGRTGGKRFSLLGQKDGVGRFRSKRAWFGGFFPCQLFVGIPLWSKNLRFTPHHITQIP